MSDQESPDDEQDDEHEVAQRALDQMDEHLAQAEKKILAHHSVQLTKWTREQQLALQRAAELDAGAIQARSSASDACVVAIRADVEAHAEQRDEAQTMAAESRGVREDQFHAELRELGDERATEAAECVRRCSENLRNRGEEFEGSAWEKMDSDLSAIAWREARAVHALNLPNGVAEVYNRGELQPYLDAERDGWARSQKADLERLRSEIDAECQQVFKNLEKKLKSVAPSGMLFAPALEKLQEMAAGEKRRLEELEQEVCSQYASEIDAALHRCEEDYRGYDCELQEVIFRTLDQRFKNACAMRQLKLALCRWRLDYQRAYHDQCARLASQPEPADSKDKFDNDKQQVRNAAGRRQLDKLRRAVLKIWAQGKVPVSEIHKFLGRVTESVARDGMAEPILNLYQEELKQYGALPLLEHASSPEVLSCWLDSLTAGRQDRMARSNSLT